MVTTLPLDSFHTAHLEAAAGYGLLVCPNGEDDVWLGTESVQGAAWVDAVAMLQRLGWTPRRLDSGLLSCVGRTEGGKLVLEVEAEDGALTVGADGWRMLCEAAGLVPLDEYRRA